jgi:hypothetical protein
MSTRRGFLGWAGFVAAGILAHHKPGHGGPPSTTTSTTSTSTTTTLPPGGPDTYQDVYG